MTPGPQSIANVERSGLDRLATALSVVVVAAFLVALGWFELSSVDLGYHLAYGRQFWATGRIVDVDPFIFAADGHRFVNANWLSQVVMAWLYDRLDWPALFGLRLALLAATFGFGATLMRSAGAGWRWVACGWLAAALGGYERFTMRPELFSYAIAAAILFLLARGPRLHGAAAMVALQAAWTNFHSYFLVGPILTASFLAGALLARALRNHSLRFRRPISRPSLDPPTPNASPIVQPSPSSRSALAPASESAVPLKRWALLLLFQTAACTANPWFLEGAWFPVRTLDYLHRAGAMAGSPLDPARSAWGILSEFQSPFGFFGLHGASRTTWAYAVILAVAVAGILAAAARRRWGLALALLTLAAMSTQMRRNVALLALVGVAPATAAVAAVVAPWWNRQTRLRRAAPAAACAALLGLTTWWIHGIWTGRFYFDERRPARRLAAGWSDHIFPFGAAQWLCAHPAAAQRLFADLTTCSNVLPWLPPGSSVFITTNTFAYPPEQLALSWNLCLGVEDYRGAFDRCGVSGVLLRAHDPTRPLIRSLKRDPQWALAWYDEHFVLFVRRTSAPPGGAPPALEAGSLDVRAWIDGAARPHEVPAYRLGTIASVPFCLEWYAEARALLSAAVRLEPRYYEAWNNLGICQIELGKQRLAAGDRAAAMGLFDAARRCFQNVLAIRPRHAEARFNLDHTPVAIE